VTDAVSTSSGLGAKAQAKAAMAATDTAMMATVRRFMIMLFTPLS